MALLFIDSFDHYATVDLPEKYASVIGSSSSGTVISTGIGRNGSSAFVTTPTSFGGDYVIASPGGIVGTVVVAGAAVNPSRMPPVGSQSHPIFSLLDSGAQQLSVLLATDGKLVVTRGYYGGPVLGVTSIALSVGVFTYVEFKSTIHPSAGTLEVRFNGATVLGPLTGLNTAANGFARWSALGLGNLNSNTSNPQPAITYDDLYILDGSGTTLNDFLGDCRVHVRYPTAEGASSAWVPSSGTDNALMVDETVPDDDATYNATATVGNTDTFVVPDAVVGSTIHGVQVTISQKKSDAGPCSIAAVARTSSVDHLGPDKNPGTAYTYATTVFQEAASGVAWTETNFNAAEFGYKRTA